MDDRKGGGKREERRKREEGGGEVDGKKRGGKRGEFCMSDRALGRETVNSGLVGDMLWESAWLEHAKKILAVRLARIRVKDLWPQTKVAT